MAAKAKSKTKTKEVPIIVALTTIRCDGVTYKPGQILDEIKDKKALDQLVKIGSAKKDIKYVETADTSKDDTGDGGQE